MVKAGLEHLVGASVHLVPGNSGIWSAVAVFSRSREEETATLLPLKCPCVHPEQGGTRKTRIAVLRGDVLHLGAEAGDGLGVVQGGGIAVLVVADGISGVDVGEVEGGQGEELVKQEAVLERKSHGFGLPDVGAGDVVAEDFEAGSGDVEMEEFEIGGGEL